MTARRRRYAPKRKPEGLLRAAKDAQAPAGWVPLGELARRLAEETAREGVNEVIRKEDTPDDA